MVNAHRLWGGESVEMLETMECWRCGLSSPAEWLENRGARCHASQPVHCYSRRHAALLADIDADLGNRGSGSDRHHSQARRKKVEKGGKLPRAPRRLGDAQKYKVHQSAPFKKENSKQFLPKALDVPAHSQKLVKPTYQA